MGAVLHWLFWIVFFGSLRYYWQQFKKCIEKGKIGKALLFVFLAIVFVLVSAPVHSMRKAGF